MDNRDLLNPLLDEGNEVISIEDDWLDSDVMSPAIEEVSNPLCAGQTYVIQPRESLLAIASRFGVTLQQLLDANSGLNPYFYRAGTTICIPTTTPAPTPTPTPAPKTCPANTTRYTLRTGDTIASIARNFGVSQEDLLRANPDINPQAITVGQVVCVPVAAPPAPSCPPGSTTYTVVSGDTIESIATRNNTTADRLRAANPNVNPNSLVVGQTICIPASTPTPNCPLGSSLYTVRSNDTFFTIAQRFNVTVEELLLANPSANPVALIPGQVLCIPRQSEPQPTCPDGYRRYTVVRGDSYSLIARRLGTTVEALIRANPNVNPNALNVGAVICVPPASTPPTPTPTPPAPPAPNCPGGSTTYTIVRGDTFSSIARRLNTTVDALVQANPNVDPRALRIGQIICVPPTTPSGRCPTGYREHTVTASDTLLSILTQYNISYGALRASNPNTNIDALKAGDVLCIPPNGSRAGCTDSMGVYIIRQGDNLNSIATAFGVNAADLLRVNPVLTPNDFVVGRLICIPRRRT